MKVVSRGVVKGKTVELQSTIALPDGTHVTVTLEPGEIHIEDKKRLAGELCGVWAQDDEISRIFDEIARERVNVYPRDIFGHVAP